MSDLMAKISALTSVALAVIVGLAVFLTSGGGLTGTVVQAEFENAFPLLPGMNVRIEGGVAGQVKGIELTSNGTALVTMVLSDGTQPPHSDATAAVRQQDITGDSYVDLSLGRSPDSLGDTTIPVKRTLVAPRLDDLLNAFNDPTREGLKLILIEAGTALERNGDDLNAAELALRPALDETSRALSEVNSQNRALRHLVDDASDVTGQAASRRRELGGLVDSLTQTLDETAAHTQATDQALEVAPLTVDEAQTTLTRLTRLANAAQPLAETLAAGAPDLTVSLNLLGPFLDDARATLNDVQPTIEVTQGLLEQAKPTLEASTAHTLTAPFDIAGGLGRFLKAVLANPHALDSLFGADSYGQLPGASNEYGLGSVAVERGNLLGYQSASPQQRFLRAVGVPSCMVFGLPIKPGCLALAASGSTIEPVDRPERPRPDPEPAAPEQPAPEQPHQPAAPAPPDDSGQGGGNGPLPDLPKLPVPDIPGVTHDGHLDLPGNGALNDLLNFLLGGGQS